MSEELRQNVVNAAGEKLSAWIVSLGTVGTGLSTVLELLPTIIGGLSSLVGFGLSSVLIYGQIKKGRIERQLLYLQRDELIRKKQEREDRKATGEPCRRSED